MIPRALGLICQHGLGGPGQSWRRGTLVHIRVGPALAVCVALAVCLVVTVDPAVTAQIRGAVSQAAVRELQVVLRGVVQLQGGVARLSQDPRTRPSLVSDQIPDPGHQPSTSVPNQGKTLTSGQILTTDLPPALTRYLVLGRPDGPGLLLADDGLELLVPAVTRAMQRDGGCGEGASAQRRPGPGPIVCPGPPAPSPPVKRCSLCLRSFWAWA